MHLWSQGSLASLFIVFKVQILKSFVSRKRLQIARKYCFFVFLMGLPCPVLVSFSHTHCKYPPTSFVWTFVCNYSKICAMFYWLPGGLVVLLPPPAFTALWSGCMSSSPSGAFLGSPLYNWFRRQHIPSPQFVCEPGYPRCFLNGSHCLWWGSSLPFRLQPLPTPLHFCLKSTFSRN